MATDIENWHPKLIGKDYKIITVEYEIDLFNCFAYVIDIHEHYCGSWEKSWPYEIIGSREPTLENYMKFYSLYGYTQKSDNSYEIEFDKIAIYIDNNNQVSHAARQYENIWRSKLGPDCIIEHELEWLTGYDADNYGEIGVILKYKKS